MAPSSENNLDGYRSPPFAALAAVTAGITAALLLMFELSDVAWFAILQTLAVLAPLLFAVHELLRPFCCSFPELCALMLHVALATPSAVIAILRRGGAPRFAEWTLAYEIFRGLASALGERGGAHIVKPLNVVALRRVFDTIGALTREFSCRYHNTVAENFRHLGLEHIWIKPRHDGDASNATAADTSARRVVVLYYHGGGYALCSPRFYVGFGNRLRGQIAEAIAARRSSSSNEQSDCEPLQVHVLLANYRKIPEHRFPAPVDDALAMYDYLVNDVKVPPSQIVMAGDSAGGGLVIATLLRLRDAQRALPAAALTICPFVDMMEDVAVSEHCFISKSMLAGIRDHCLAAEAAARAGSCEKRKSGLREAVTINADLRGLPPLLILAAEFDILLNQSLGLEATARHHNVEVEIDLHERMPHVFCLMPANVLPQSDAGIASLAAFAARRLVPEPAARSC